MASCAATLRALSPGRFSLLLSPPPPPPLPPPSFQDWPGRRGAGGEGLRKFAPRAGARGAAKKSGAHLLSDSYSTSRHRLSQISNQGLHRSKMRKLPSRLRRHINTIMFLVHILIFFSRNNVSSLRRCSAGVCPVGPGPSEVTQWDHPCGGRKARGKGRAGLAEARGYT